MKDPKAILITGASSGIGAALAYEYAAPGRTLFLSGRDEARLGEVATFAAGKGAAVFTKIVDVVDTAAMAAWVEACFAQTSVELAIVNAGLSAGTGGGGEAFAQAQRLFATNLTGALNTLYPALAHMQKRGWGQIALMSSLAGLRGLPGAPAYCASKAALRVLGEALRADYAPQGIEINVICPGFVKTPMTDENGFFMPFLMSAGRAAQCIRRGLERNRARVAFPFALYAVAWLFALLPSWAADFLAAKAPRKP